MMSCDEIDVNKSKQRLGYSHNSNKSTYSIKRTGLKKI